MKGPLGLACLAISLAGTTTARDGLSQPPTAATLSLSVFVGQPKAFASTSTFIYGRTQGILVDTLYYNSDAAAVADGIEATGRRLTAIIVTHSDDDHYMGASMLLKRFPGTPVYMTARALDRFKRNVAGDADFLKKYVEGEAPDPLPTAKALPTNHFSIDGAAVDVVTDLQGDVRQPANSFVWIPSLRAIIAGDIVFNGVHVWLADSTEESRRDWQGSLDRLLALHPAVVVAGHKANRDLQDDPKSIAFMREYLVAFEDARRASTNADELVAKVKERFPGLALDNILVRAAKRAFPAAP